MCRDLDEMEHDPGQDPGINQAANRRRFGMQMAPPEIA
jgi:hypothetical protein